MLREEEAEILVEKKIESLQDCKKVCEMIHFRGVEHIVIIRKNQVYYFSNEEKGHLNLEENEIIDITGSEDAMTATVIYSLMNGKSLREACQLSVASFLLTVQTSHSVSSEMSLENFYRLKKQLKEKRLM